jgi:hypothetical protein
VNDAGVQLKRFRDKLSDRVEVYKGLKVSSAPCPFREAVRLANVFD